MKIRPKLLILLLAIALVPLVVSALLHRRWQRRLGQHLAAGTRSALTEGARQHLRALVDDYGRILRSNRQRLELALKLQAREVEHRLTGPAPAPQRYLLADEIDKGVNVPNDMQRSAKHLRPGPDGEPQPALVTFAHQVYFLPKGLTQQAVADEMARLWSMSEVYRDLYRSDPDSIYWQYTALESGLHSSYPGKGGYPADYDPRDRPWYRRAMAAGSLVWVPPTIDATTRTVLLAVSTPVRRPDGTLAGVTGIDVPLTGIFQELKLPAAWSQGAEAMLVAPAPQPSEQAGQLLILARKGYQRLDQDWQTPVTLEVLQADEPAQLEALTTDALAGRSGVHEIAYRGRPALWAHGAGGGHEPFPIVIVGKDVITAQAVEAENYVLRKTAESLQITGIILLAVAAAVAVIAFVSSRSVTRPVRQLAEAAEKLAAGDFAAQAAIRSRDELGELGAIFDEMGPQLQERQRMKQSLALAMEIQQHLLPQEPPKLPGFDIAGKSLYCDETGGDYYDFISLIELGQDKLGIAVGDVTGHGIGAALLMASARGVLRSHAAGHGDDLAKLFGALNAHLVRDTGEERFMTLFYGVLDAPTRTLWWASAGHDPPLWLRHATGAIDELPNTGIPLGVLDEAGYQRAGPARMEAGDVVVIGTDGIWEAANPDGELFGKRRLCDVIAASADRTADEIHADIVAAVGAFRGRAPQTDDITLVVIKALQA